MTRSVKKTFRWFSIVCLVLVFLFSNVFNSLVVIALNYARNSNIVDLLWQAEHSKSVVDNFFVDNLLPRQAKAAEVLIDADITDSTDEFGPSPAVVMITDQIGYVFFIETGNDLAYRKTTDGGNTWAASTIINNIVTGWTNVSVWYDQWTPGDNSNTKIHIAASDDGTDDIYYTYLDTNGDTLKGSVVMAVSGSTTLTEAADGPPSITKGASGNLFISGNFTNTAGGKVSKCTDGTGDIWEDATPSGWSSVNIDQIQLLPLLTGDDIIAIKAETANNAIKYQIYDETTTDNWAGSWTNIATLVENTTYDQWFSATISKTTGDVYLAFANYTNNVANDIEFWSFDESDRGSGFIKGTNNVYDNSNLVLSPVPLFDEATGDIYVAYISGRIFGAIGNYTNIYYKKSSDGGDTWSIEYGPIANDLEDDYRYITGNMLSSDRLAIMYYCDDRNDIFFTTILSQGELVENNVDTYITDASDEYGPSPSGVFTDANTGYEFFVRSNAVLDATDEFGASPSVVFIDANVGYAFFINSKNNTYTDKQNLVYAKTEDGGDHWTARQTIDASIIGWTNVAVWYDQWTPGDTTGTKIHIAASDDVSDDIYYTYLDTNTDTLKGSMVMAVPGTTTLTEAADGPPSITKGAGGNLFISANFTNTAGGKVYKCTDGTGDSWSNATPSGWSTVAIDQIQLLPLLTGDDIIAIKAQTADDTIRYQIYDEANDQWPDSWTNIATLVESTTYDQWFSATIKKSTGDVYLTFANYTGNAANDIEFWRFDESDRGSGFVKGTNNVYDNSNTVMMPVPLVEEDTGDIYVAYFRGTLGSSVRVYYKSSSDGGNTWSAESTTVSPTVADDMKALRGNILSNDNLYVVWYNDDTNTLSGNNLLSPDAVDNSIASQAVVYRKTTNGGASWDSLNVVATHGGTVSVAVWYDQWTPGDTTGTKIHIAYSDDYTDDYYYTYLDTNGDIYPATSTPVILGTAITEAAAGPPSITKGASGNLFLSGTLTTPAGNDVYKSTDGGVSWYDATPSGWSSVNIDQIQLLPLLTGNDIIAIKAETASNAIKYQIYDETTTDTWAGSWSNIATLVESTTYDQWFSATIKKSTGDIYLTFANATAVAGNDIEFWRFDESDRGSGFVKSNNNVYDNSNTVISPVVLMDENTGNIFVAYLRGTLATSMGMYYKYSTDGGDTWSAESGNLSPGILDDHKYMRGNLLSYDRLYIFWHNDDLNDIMGKEIPFLVVAEVSISISTDGVVSFDGIPLDGSQDNTDTGINDVEIISIDSGPADLDIKTTVFSEGANTWTLGAANGSNQVKWEFATSTSNWVSFLLPDTNYEMDLNVSQSTTRNIYLRITTPTNSDSFGQYSATITITASTP